jgi:hypothetical protein
MHARFRFLAAIALIITGIAIFAFWGTAQQSAEKPAEKGKAPEHSFSGPYTHDNLTIFLVHGEDRLKGRKYMMLSEALEKKLLVIHETQSVSHLTMENLSPEHDVLILSGDILKGGQQDRVANFDQFVPAKSGKLPLTVFCIEHTAGRWLREKTETDKTFASSPGCLSSNGLRLANRAAMNQGQVWDNVAKAQDKLSEKAGKDLKSSESVSSLALTLQAKEVQAATEKYATQLAPLVKDKTDALGYVFAINGKIYAADIYCSPILFQKAWPNLIRANAIEAFAEKQKDKTFAPVTIAAVKSFLDAGDKGKTSATKEVSSSVRQVTNEAEKVYRFESRDLTMPAKTPFLRSNYIAK